MNRNCTKNFENHYVVPNTASSVSNYQSIFYWALQYCQNHTIKKLTAFFTCAIFHFLLSNSFFSLKLLITKEFYRNNTAMPSEKLHTQLPNQ